MREWYRGRRLLLIIACMAITLVSCGGSSTESSGGGGGSTAGAITLSADPPEGVAADGASSAAITATVVDSAGGPAAAGTAVTFSTTLGFFRNGNATYTMSIQGEEGVAVASLCSLIAGTAQVTVSSAGTSQRVTVGFVVPPDVPSTLTLATDKTTVKSDDSNSATITATVRTASSAVIAEVPVAFTATGGQISASSAETDDQGRAQITFSAGADKANHTVTITASVFGLEDRSVEVTIVGTTVILSVERTNIEIGAPPVPLVARVRDAGEESVGPGVLVTITAESTGEAAAPLILAATPNGMILPSQYSGVTNQNGEVTVQLSGASSGGVTITARALGAAASKDFVVGEAGFVFGITSPEDDPAPLYVGENLTIDVNAPNQDAVLFVTTLGTLTGTAEAGQVITEPVVETTATAILNSTVAGTATIWVMDAVDPYTADSLKVDISPAVGDASQIALQANPTVIETNAGDLNTATLLATVRNADDQVVRGAPVVFSMERATGGGEFVSPSIAYTNSQGQATATFTAGSLASGANGVGVCASVAERPDMTESCVSIVIGGTPGSVAISQGSVIESVNNDTAYRLPMSVLVTDTAGSPVGGAAVTLKIWPARCATGYWVEVEEDKCEPVYECVLLNEDANENLRMDAGEDTNGDGTLTPAQAAAGGLPSQVTTDENGLATFDLIYPKSSAAWVEDRIMATTLVHGTETRSAYTFWLPWEEGEACNLPTSPYRTKSVTLAAEPATLTADGFSTSTISAVVIDALNRPVADGEIVAFGVISGTGTVDPAVAETVGGIAQTTYTASAIAGTETVAAQAVGAACAYDTVDITLTLTTSPTADIAWADLGDQQHVLFTDESYPSEITGAEITAWSWLFREADGTLISASVARHPGPVSLGPPGFYTAELTVTDALSRQASTMEAVEVMRQDLSVTAPTANFTWDDLEDGEHVLLADASSAALGTTLAGWSWQFRQADGTLLSTSNARNPGSVSLTGSSGNYIVSLTVTNNLGEADTTMKMVRVADQAVSATVPEADFTWNDLEDQQHVLFADNSFAAAGTTLTAWLWQFRQADGTLISTSDEENPGSVNLSPSGAVGEDTNYIVTLTVWNDRDPAESDTMVKMVTVAGEVVSDTAPTAGFASDDLGDQQHVLFADNSFAEAGTTLTAWLWQFRQADGTLISTSDEENPGSVNLSPSGPVGEDTNYIVTLTVWNDRDPAESDTAVEKVTVAGKVVSDTAPTADFANEGVDLGDGQHALFADASQPADGTTLTGWLWIFRQADGTLISTSNAQNPGSVNLSPSGAVGMETSFVVSLTVWNSQDPAESDTTVKMVTLEPAP